MDTNTSVQSVLQKAIDGATATKDFLAGQIPDVVHQLLVFSMWKYGLGFLFFISIFGLMVWGIKRMVQWDEDNIPFAVILGMINLAPAAAALFCAGTFIELLVAPKLWLLEYAAHLVKG